MEQAQVGAQGGKVCGGIHHMVLRCLTLRGLSFPFSTVGREQPPSSLGFCKQLKRSRCTRPLVDKMAPVSPSISPGPLSSSKPERRCRSIGRMERILAKDYAVLPSLLPWEDRQPPLPNARGDKFEVGNDSLHHKDRMACLLQTSSGWGSTGRDRHRPHRTEQQPKPTIPSTCTFPSYSPQTGSKQTHSPQRKHRPGTIPSHMQTRGSQDRGPPHGAGPARSRGGLSVSRSWGRGWLCLLQPMWAVTPPPGVADSGAQRCRRGSQGRRGSGLRDSREDRCR